jgi:hypothetical protein
MDPRLAVAIGDREKGHWMSTVHIKFERVQTWLFSIPRLRAMVGANVLLGEVLQHKLPALVASGEGRWEVKRPGKDKKFPKRDKDDLPHDHDDPRDDAERGITSRHGGHFEVQLVRGEEALAAAAAELLRRELPGLRFQIEIDGEAPPARSATLISAELPVLAPCAWSGEGLASAVAKQGSDREPASLEACRRQEAARRAERGAPLSLASALMSEVPGRLADTFDELVGDRYMAVIHADGNGVGAGLKRDAGALLQAGFHHRNRVLLKRALRDAMMKCRDPDDERSEDAVAPLIPLMLGGDDLLVVCRATVALQFVKDLCAKLAELQQHRKSGEFLLTLGVGVTFAPFTLPFHQLHQVAEALASSAKRKEAKKAFSVVDWAVFTSAWAEKDLAKYRRQHWVRGPSSTPRLLSQRPLPVLAQPHHPRSLEQLLLGANLLEERQAPRSQLRYLVEQLSRGEQLAELAWEELSKEAHDALEAAGVSRVWDSEQERSGKEPALRFTAIHDLVEVYEIPRLGAGRRPARQPAQEETHA